MSEPDAVTMYRCVACGGRKPIPGQRPLNPQPSIRTGCPRCERLHDFRPQGVR